MNKRKILTVLLFVLPLLVVLIGSGRAGVMVFDGEVTTYYPWLQLLSFSQVGWCAPVAALLNYGVFALAVVYGLKKDIRWVKAIRGISVVAGCLAVLPNLIRADVMVIPNVFGAIALFAVALAADMLLKEEQKNQQKVTSGKKLKRR